MCHILWSDKTACAVVFPVHRKSLSRLQMCNWVRDEFRNGTGSNSGIGQALTKDPAKLIGKRRNKNTLQTRAEVKFHRTDTCTGSLVTGLSLLARGGIRTPYRRELRSSFAELIHWASEVAAKQRKYFMMSRPKIKPKRAEVKFRRIMTQCQRECGTKLIGKRRNKNTLQKRAEVKFRRTKLIGKRRNKNTLQKRAEVKFRRQDIAKCTTGGEELPIVNNVKAAVKLSSIVEVRYPVGFKTATSSVPEHSFIVVEQLISQDILGLQQQGLVLDFTTSPVSDTVARQSCYNTCEHTSTTTRPRSTAAAVNMESRAREESKVNEEQHKSHLEQAFQRLRVAGLTLSRSKCQIGMAPTMGHSLSMDTGCPTTCNGELGSQCPMQRPSQKLVTIDGTCPQFSPPMGTYSCPGSYIAYTCVLSSGAPLGVVTVWGGSAFQCPPTNHISLTQRAGGTVQTFTPGSCGNLSAVTTNVTSTCYTSVLTIPAVQALNGTTVVCQDGNTGAVVGIGTMNLRMPASPGPVGNMTVTSTSVDQLTVTWTPPTTGGVPTSYNVTINDSSSPVVIADNGSPPVYTHTFTGLVSDTLYTVSVVAINCAGASNAVQHHRRTWTFEKYINAKVSSRGPSNAIIGCSFLNNQSFYCVVCCSTDPSVPPDSSVYNISTTRGTEVTVSLQGLTSGQMYYCTAAGTDANSSSCGGPVVGGVEAYVNISAGLDKIADSVSFSGSGCLQSSTIIIILLSALVPAILGCYQPY
eukprot:Em0039g11a